MKTLEEIKDLMVGKSVITNLADLLHANDSLYDKPPIRDYPHYRRFLLQYGRLPGDIFLSVWQLMRLSAICTSSIFTDPVR